MGISRVNRRSNTSADYLISKFGRHYSDKTIKALVKLIGVKESALAMQAAIDFVDGNYAKSLRASPDNLMIKQGHERQYNGLAALLTVIYQHYEHKPGLEGFVATINEQVTTFQKTTREMEALSLRQQKQLFEPDSETPQPNKLLAVCIALSYVNDMSQKDLIVNHINQRLRMGHLKRLMGSGSALRIPQHVRLPHAFDTIVISAIRSCTNGSTFSTLYAKVCVDVAKVSRYYSSVESTLFDIS